ncbi:hypothetical protein TCAL_16119 [Tigriopus californicus]|uniref:Uncharacterized protein n=1 Tax=Tigriopus californicus TaxID=6832 RepID=A0A553PPX1_TIGCA|nr:hypothetical protein TCAL_16119 [Tigriopus californicus]
MNQADNEQRSKGVDSLLNFETVKYYAAEHYEIDRYEEADLELSVPNIFDIAERNSKLIINGGLLVGSLYCCIVWYQRISYTRRLCPIRDLYLATHGPLNFLAHYTGTGDPGSFINWKHA